MVLSGIDIDIVTPVLKVDIGLTRHVTSHVPDMRVDGDARVGVGNPGRGTMELTDLRMKTPRGLMRAHEHVQGERRGGYLRNVLKDEVRKRTMQAELKLTNPATPGARARVPVLVHRTITRVAGIAWQAAAPQTRAVRAD
jgi:hypothetical protein